MRVFLVIGFFIACSWVAAQQTVADFENFELETGDFLNGSDGTGGYQSGNIYLINDYDTNYSSWSGWAISAVNDNVTPGFANQYASIAGTGLEGSDTYATTFIFGSSIMRMEGAAAGSIVEGLYVSNGAYPFYSMQLGDQFAKRFGGESGDDPDFFLLTIRKYEDGTISQDSVDFYLADYRFEDNSMDYILEDWAYIDLTSLGNCDSLSFTLSSSDVGAFGMNTPAYFCVDNVITQDRETSNTEISLDNIKVFPNPISDFISIETSQVGEKFALLQNANGELLKTFKFSSANYSIQVGGLNPSVYFLTLQDENALYTEKLLKLD